MEWREDLRKVLRRAGGEYKPTVFLFSDTQVGQLRPAAFPLSPVHLSSPHRPLPSPPPPQIKDEGFVEDINNLLNSGEVPNMFPADERMQASGTWEGGRYRGTC